MTLSEVLRQARAHVGGGWHEPLSLSSTGTICGPTDEGIARFCAFDALQVACAFDGAVHLRAEDTLVEALRASSALDLAVWLEDPRRTRDDVVQLFGRAHSRARALEAR